MTTLDSTDTEWRIMIPEHNGVIQRKLSLLDDQVGRLKTHLENVTEEEFKDDWVLRSMAERALQVCAEIMIDIAERIIAIKAAGPVATSVEAMRRLVELQVIKSEDPYIKIVGFRNLIVHHYEEIDPEILFDIVKNRIDAFRRFRDEIDRFVAGD